MYQRSERLHLPLLLGFLLLGSLGACQQTGGQQQASMRSGIYAVSSPQESQQLSQLGRQLFFEPALSASGKQSCASCHSPEHAYGPPDGQSVQFGGIDGKQMGSRAVPSLRYLQTVPPFSEHFRDNDGNDSEDAGPTGGFTWDGRAPAHTNRHAFRYWRPMKWPIAVVIR
jgi:cytochrome c peroxidase